MPQDQLPVSPLAPDAFPDMPAIGGVGLAACAAGVRYAGRTDVLLAKLAQGTTAAGGARAGAAGYECVHRHRWIGVASDSPATSWTGTSRAAARADAGATYREQ